MNLPCLDRPTSSTDQTICQSFLELPTLCVTGAQARRLWHLDTRACEDALHLLVACGFLRVTLDGQYCRADHLPTDSEPFMTFD